MNLETVKSAAIKKFQQMESEDKKKFIGRGILFLIFVALVINGGFIVLGGHTEPNTFINFISAILYLVTSIVIIGGSIILAIIYLFNGFKWPS